MQWIIICLIVGVGAHQIYIVSGASQYHKGGTEPRKSRISRKIRQRPSPLNADVDKVAAED
jgi:hypothetical protein